MAPHWRPPYGAVNQRVRDVAASLGFTKMWLWDVDSLDWRHLGNTQGIIKEWREGWSGAASPSPTSCFTTSRPRWRR